MFPVFQDLLRLGKFALFENEAKTLANAKIVHRQDIGPVEAENQQHLDRRKMLYGCAGVVLGAPNLLGAEEKGTGKTFKIGLIGCGGRGLEAAKDSLEVGKLALSGDHLVEQQVRNVDIANWFCGQPPVSAVGFGGRAQRQAGDMYDFFSIDYDYGNGVHIHSMCRQINGCYNWTGHDFVYEKGRTNGANYPKPQQSPIPADLPQGTTGSQQEQIDTLYSVNKGKPLDQARAVAESSAAAILGRISTYTGQQVTWKEIMVDPDINPELYNLTLKPAES